jgi:peroxiredoxin
MSLQARLDAFKADFEAGKPPYNVPPSVIATMRRATAELIASGLAERALKVGDRAPALRAQRRQRCGRSFVRVPGARSVGRQLLSGRLVSFATWNCRRLQAALPEFQRLGASLIAISPQTAANSRKSARDNRLAFPILGDPNNAVAAAFGLRFERPNYLVALYKNLKNDLPGFNGDSSWTLPMPARFVIGADGALRYAEVNPDYTKRPEPEAMLPALRDAATRRAA